VESTRGQLLIAGPTLLDPNFQRTVVLVVEHSQEGALGLVLNRPSQTTVGEAVDELSELVDSEEPLFIGGPVQQSALIVLAEFQDAGRAAVVAFEARTMRTLPTPGAAARSPVTRAGAPVSWTASLQAGTGSWSPRSARTRSAGPPVSCGRRCWNARAAATRSWPGCRPTPR
jgi:putative AlgH/UPF0301 family transcriptional regulator